MRFGIRTSSNRSVDPGVAVPGGLELYGQLLPGNRPGGQAEFPRRLRSMYHIFRDELLIIAGKTGRAYP